jgi:hypothetical protein
MTHLQIAERQLNILRELDKLTPPSDESPSLKVIQNLIERRQRLINRWPTLPKGADSDPAVKAILEEVQQLAQSVLKRDQFLVKSLKTARDRILNLIRRSGVSLSAAPVMVRRQA